MKVIQHAAACLTIACSLSAVAQVWEVGPEKVGGRSGAEQIIDRFESSDFKSGDVIRVRPGTYDFTWLVMDGDGGVYTHLSRKHKTLIATFTIEGDTSGHWDDQVIFICNKRMGDFTHMGEGTDNAGAYPCFKNITFKNGSCNNGSGGAFYFAAWSDMANGNYPVLTNCVIQGFSAKEGGAVYGGAKVIDCKIVGNKSQYNWGAIYDCAAYGCDFIENTAGANGNFGAAGEHHGLVGCNFINNASSNNCGAVQATSAPISNCVFVGSVCRSNGGAIWGNSESLGEIVDCTFLTNSAMFKGGAVYFGEKGSPVVSNCTFRANRVETTYSTSQGGVIYHGATSDALLNPVIGCVFEDNVNSNKGPVAYGGYYVNCQFNRNKGVDTPGAAIYYPMNAGGAYGCSFTSNSMEHVSGYCWGGAITCENGCRRPVVECAFTNNVSGWAAGAIQNCAATNCTFKGNESKANGAGVANSIAYNCFFADNYNPQNWYRGGEAWNSQLIKCDISGTSGLIDRCVVDRCYVHDIISGYTVFSGRCFVTNSLIARCGGIGQGGIVNAYEDNAPGSEFVNCTFADNFMRDNRGMFWSYDGLKLIPIKCVNCLFSGNTNALGVAKDICGANLSSGLVSLQNCAYGAADPSFAESWTDVGASCLVVEDAKFVPGDYQLQYRSPARGRGLMLNWTEFDFDLAGNKRIRDGKVDLGCYQCWINPRGLCLILK